jgi:enoyl-CoA hydratase/carnithine racemase
MSEIHADGRLVLEPGRIARLTLAAPASRNAMTRAMWAALPAIAARIAADRDIRVLVLTGAGGAFCAGADIAEFAEVYATAESAAAYNATVRAAIEALRSLPRPVLARIEGPCVGGGVALALACDLRFADPGAVFAITPARLGIAYSPADTALVVGAVGAAAAKDLLFSARRLDAAEARALGLVDRVSEADGLDTAVAEYAETLARLSPASIAQAKATVNALAPACADPALLAGFAALFSGPDFAEGRAAFLGRRAPEF